MGSRLINDALQFRGPFPRVFALGKHHRNHSGRLRRRAFLSDLRIANDQKNMNQRFAFILS